MNNNINQRILCSFIVTMHMRLIIFSLAGTSCILWKIRLFCKFGKKSSFFIPQIFLFQTLKFCKFNKQTLDLNYIFLWLTLCWGERVWTKWITLNHNINDFLGTRSCWGQSWCQISQLNICFCLEQDGTTYGPRRPIYWLDLPLFGWNLACDTQIKL